MSFNKCVVCASLAIAMALGSWAGSAWGTSGICLLEDELVLPQHTCEECQADWTGTRWEHCGYNPTWSPEEECLLPTNTDGAFCWEMNLSCGGMRLQFLDSNCQDRDPTDSYFGMYYCQRPYTTAANFDMGDYPICPQN